MRYWFVIVSVVLLTACSYSPFGFTDIGEVKRNPSSFEGKEIKIKGTVVDTVKIPLIATKYFLLRDQSGEIAVYTEGVLPGVQQKVSVRVRVDNMAVFGETTVGLHMIELERLPNLLN